MKQEWADLRDVLSAQPGRVAACIALIYFAIGSGALLCLEQLFPQPVWPLALTGGAFLLGQVFFVAAGAGLLFLLSRTLLIRLRQERRQALLHLQDLEESCEELMAADESLKQQYAALAIKEQELFEHMHDGFALHEVICDAQGMAVDFRYLSVNPAFEFLTGKSRDELVGRRMRELLPFFGPERIAAYARVALTGEAVSSVEVIPELGRQYSVRAYCPQPGQFAVLTQDITEQRKQAEMIRRLAYYDALTGMPNREYFVERLKEELRRPGCAGAVLCIKLDDIRTVNDVFGHASGDVVIITAGTYIVAESGTDSFAARTGGSEFTVLLAGQQDREMIGAIAENIIGVLACQCELGESSYDMSASIGIALYPADGQTVGDVLKNATAAVHDAQKAGIKNWRFYQHLMQQESYERLLMCSKLRDAIDKGELHLVYQPQVTVAGELVGFEALLRWNSPEHGVVSPDKFIPLAEANHLIQPIGEWVLKEACRFLRCLAEHGCQRLCVAVNVSPHQLAAGNFTDMVRDTLNEFSIPPGRLELEITETVLMTSLSENNKKLKELQEMGVRLSLDDFGTGYSSLTYLQNLPVETLKIDKSFIDMLLRDGLKSAIVRAIVEMAHALNLAVVAEGVETAEQWHYLMGCHCDRMQGYLFGHPLTMDQALVKSLAEQNGPRAAISGCGEK